MHTRRISLLAAVGLLLGGFTPGVAPAMAAAPAVGAAPSPLETASSSTGARERLDLNQGWRFTRENPAGAQEVGFDDRAWEEVSIPHTWNAADGADGGDDYSRGIGWYRSIHSVPAALAGKELYLQFAGVNQVAEVWVNGVRLGQHVGGYARFRFNATDALKVGADNVIAVRVDNSHNPDIAPLRADFSFQGGIYRNVSLWAVDPLQIRMLDQAGPGVYLRQREVTGDKAVVDVTAKLWNNHETGRTVAVRTTIRDDAGKVIARHTTDAVPIAAVAELQTTQTLVLPNPRLWQGTEDPYLYQSSVELIDTSSGQVTDRVTEPLGLRSVRVEPDKGFLLNNEHLKLRGVNLHQDRAGQGWALNNDDHIQDLSIIKEMGANAIRMAHYQHDQKDYDLADELGFVVYAEIPFINEYTDSPAFEQNLHQQLVELIRQNYNHPSIVFWGIGNEERTDDKRTNQLLDGLADLADAEDPDRITSYASCCVSDTSPVTMHAETASYNKYFGWYSRSVHDLGGWADRLHSNDPTRAIGLTEYGAGANLGQHTADPSVPTTTGQWHPEEYQAYFHEESWKQIAERDFIWGSFVWNMFDFASDRRAEGDQPGINDKGLVSYDRTTRKDAFYWYKTQWADTPTLHITSKRWVDRTDPAAELKVYSNASSVTAYLNGVSLGSRSGEDGIFRWSAGLKFGTNSIRVEAVINGVKHTDTTTWILRPRTGVFEAERADAQSGTTVIDTPGTGSAVGMIERGDWLVYKNVDLGKANVIDVGDDTRSRIGVRVSSNSEKGGTIQIRLNSTSGPIIGSIPISSTGGWDQYDGKYAMTNVHGIHDLFITFESPSKKGIVNIDYFSIRPSGSETSSPSS